MALAGVLSAVRELILDVEEIPLTLEERRTTYHKMIPTLSSLEVDDLAKIPPEQVKTYTSCIYNGERSTLKSHFPMTLKVLERSWKGVYKTDFDSLALTKRLQRTRPWRGNTTEYLAQNFVDYVGEDLRELALAFPEAIELARMEFISLQIRRIKEENAKSKPLAPSDLTKLTVTDLLALNFAIPQTTFLEEFRVNVVEVYKNFRESDEVSVPIAFEPVFAVGSRTADNYLRWQAIPSNIFNFLKSTPYRKPTEISDLAGAYSDIADPSCSEEELFSGFFNLLVSLMVSRVVVVHGAF